MTRVLAHALTAAYGGALPLAHSSAMPRDQHRYRITVTPVETNGQQCTGRCTIEFEQRSEHDWMRQLESAQSRRTLSCNADATVVVAAGLLRTLADQCKQTPAHPLATLQPQLDELLGKLDQLQHGS
ncbi:MAG: DUF3861 family protein [Stenotrophomonas sp.]